MGWTRRWRINSQGKLKRVLGGLSAIVVDPRAPFELVVREEHRDKTDSQRRLFHAIVSEGAPQMGLTPGEAKQAVKEAFYGVEIKVIMGRRYTIVQSSEDSDRPEYSGLIDFAYQWFAEAGVCVPDRRMR